MALTGVSLIYQLAQDEIKRPDLQERIWRRIHSEILNYHRMDNWRRDLVEDVYQFEIANTAVPLQFQVAGANSLFMNFAGQLQPNINVQVINLEAFPRFRKVNYMRKWQTVTPYGTAIYDPTTGNQGTVQGGDLVERNPDSMFDGYGYDKTNTFYRSGNKIMVSSSTPLSQVYWGWFIDPVTTIGCQNEAEFQTCISWIADDYPNLIAYAVASSIFASIGKTEEANSLGKTKLAEQVGKLQGNETRLALR